MFRKAATALFLTALSTTAFAQSVSGTVTYPDGSAVPRAPVQAKNKATGAAVRTTTKADGRFTFARLGAGEYEIRVSMPCCAYSQAVESATVETGKTTQVNARLVETVNGSTLGDDPGRLVDAMLKRAKVPARPTPRAAGGRPDLSGVWLVTDDPFPERPQVLPWVEPIVKQRADGLGKDHPHNRCLPGSPPVPASSSPFIAKMVDTPGLIVMLFEDVPGFRQIFLDGRQHPADSDSWMGHSTGKWEGDTLVVDTVGFSEQLWVGPPQGLYPHTEKLRMTERYTRTDFGHMEVRATFEDPGAFTTPLRETIKFDLAPQEELLEFVCENNKPQHLVGR